ncbi:MAG TPA: hypothetical protein PLV55_06110 [Anaerohalosphaeraceae bacterium]|nr:hypothetical protein [Anaerohalosphaeraceae bacterium]
MNRRLYSVSLEEIAEYIRQNPDLSCVNAEQFWKYYAVDADPPWTDSNGKPVRNWKQKLRTWAAHSRFIASKTKQKLPVIPGKICSVKQCGMPAVYKKSGFFADTYFCREHMPETIKKLYS